ncbi:stalk domain-containing protein [Paenibacillus sp. CAU 1782]
MKKKVILLAVALMLVATGVVSAAANWGKFEGYNIVKLVINGKEVVPKDTPPVILKGRTMVPLSMLKEAGIEATWDSETYTVNIKTDSTAGVTEKDITQLKMLFLASDHYKSIESLGKSLSSLPNSFSLAFQEINNKGTSTYIDTAYKHLNGYMDIYNDEVEYHNGAKQSFTDIGINMDKASLILNHYFDAIEYYKTSIDYLELYSITRNPSHFDIYLDNAADGFDAVHDGLNLVQPEYLKLKRQIIEY